MGRGGGDVMMPWARTEGARRRRRVESVGVMVNECRDWGRVLEDKREVADGYSKLVSRAKLST